MANFYYWIVECKTPDCSILLLDEIGIVDHWRRPLVPRCADFAAICPDCMKEHTYAERDLKIRQREPFPDFQPHRAFWDAIRKARHQDEILARERYPEEPQ